MSESLADVVHEAVERAKADEQIPDHQPTYCTARGRGWASCCCGWVTDPTKSGNQMWAQLEFGKHLVRVQPAATC